MLAMDMPAVACKDAMESLTHSLSRLLGHKYNATVSCVILTCSYQSASAVVSVVF